MLIAVILLLAAGTYATRFAGIVLRERVALPEALRRLLPMAAVTLLVALAATAALTEAGRIAGLARSAGVLVGLLLAWRRAPFLVVVIAAATTTAALRLLGVP